MIILILTLEDSPYKASTKQLVVSHGVDLDTGKIVILPCEPLYTFPEAKYNIALAEWVLE